MKNVPTLCVNYCIMRCDHQVSGMHYIQNSSGSCVPSTVMCFQFQSASMYHCKVWPCLQSYVLLICIIVKSEWVLYPVKLTLLQKMADFKKQCMCIQLCFILGRSATETLEILELAFREETTRRTQVFDWFSN